MQTWVERGQDQRSEKIDYNDPRKSVNHICAIPQKN